MQLFDEFKKRYQNISSESFRIFTPYRICPLGAHVDHQKGSINGMAIDKGITFIITPATNGMILAESLNFPGICAFSTSDELKKAGFWGDYVKAALWSLRQNGYEITNGFCGLMHGELPVGGLSSSAAVIISCIKAFCIVNGISLNEEQVISVALKAEREFIGLRCGALDQSCEVLCKKEHLLYLDTFDSSYKNIPFSSKMPDFEIAVFFSGLERSLVSSKYNLRTDELKAAAYALLAYSGTDYGEMDKTVLRDIPENVYREHSEKLPEAFRKRCEHYYSEMQRVHKGTRAFADGNLELYGKYMFESGFSSINNYEAGSPELIAIHNIMTETDGIYGGRFSGAGFKGCCIALIDPSKKESIEQTVTNRYLSEFPHLKEKFSVHFCKSADGCGAIEG